MLDKYYRFEKRINDTIKNGFVSKVVHKLILTKIRYDLNKNKIVIGSEMGITDNEYQEELIVSLTSFPDRIPLLKYCLESILTQTMKPNRIVLWLAREQFPLEKKELPPEILSMQSRGLEISFCDDLRSHKKYYYTMAENPNACVITLDDDIFYPENTIEELYNAHVKNPGLICANRGHLINSDEGRILEYSKWIHAYKGKNYDVFKICPTGVGGVLYPPNCLSDEVFNKEDIKKLCLKADDLWLKIMSLRKGTGCILTEGCYNRFFVVPDSQKVALNTDNVAGNMNDLQLKNILSKYPVEIH